MKYILICLTFLLSTGLNNAVLAQNDITTEPGTINVNTTAQVQLPADLIQFNITINAEADSPREAYEQHQKLEEVLVSLLEEYNINEEDIQFEPIAINGYRDRSDEGMMETYYRTRQTVQVTFSDFDIYEEIQIALIKNGFDDFNGHFMSTKKETGMDKALQKAIEKAKTTAELMANEAGVALGPVSHMSYSNNIARPYASNRMAMSKAESGDLMQYNQTVTISATVSMEFEIGS